MLAITGLMLIGVFVGASAQISVQRYRDSVTSYQTYIKDQYSRTLYVDNDRDGRQGCDNRASVVEQEVSRGTSDCVVVGRYITTRDGSTMEAQTILAYTTSTVPSDPGASDAEDLRRYSFGLAGDTETYQLDWGSKLTASRSSAPGDVVFSLALIRSPVSGSIMTFKVSEANALVRNIDDPDRGLINNLLTRNFDVCVQNDAGGFMASPLAVRINAGASTGSAVEIPPELEGVCS